MISRFGAEPALQNLYWWKPRPKYGIFKRPHNLGDALSPFIVKHILAEVFSTIPDSPSTRKMFAIGSILNHASTGDTIWGSGVNGIKSTADHVFENLDVRAVRGPKTRAFLHTRGIECPHIFGDPGILISRCIKRNLRPGSGELYIPHFSQGKVQQGGLRTEYTIGTDFYRFVDSIVSSDIVFSASLHGLVIAESYGVPAILTMTSKTENMFKFEDYYLGSGRSEFPVALSVDEARKLAPPPLPDVQAIQTRLIDAFPQDIWA